MMHSYRACPLQRRGASASNPFSMKPGVDARVGDSGSVCERQRPVFIENGLEADTPPL